MSNPEEDNQAATEAELPFGKKFKHTLDSDEEDDEVIADKYRMEEDIEGTEKATIDFDGDIKITPFNMDEELETGHFDKEGTYIFQKGEDVRDNWMDNIDWAKVQQKPESSKDHQVEEAEDDEDVTTSSSATTEELYQQIVELVRPGESVQRAMQRFGKDCPKVVRKGQKRKMGSEKMNSDDDAKAKAAKESIVKLTSLADKLLQNGDMDIYERKYEEFQLHLNRIKQSKQVQQSTSGDDMFSDDFDVSAKPAAASETVISEPLSSTVMWEYKLEETSDAPVHGPFNSEEMQAKVDSGLFKAGCPVRRVGSDSKEWTSSKRIDFDIYF